MVAGGAGPYTCRRLIQRLRSRTSTIRRGSAVHPTAGSRGSSAGSALESQNQSVDGRRGGGTSSASRPETASVPAEHGLWLDDDDRVQERRVQSIQPDQQQAID